MKKSTRILLGASIAIITAAMLHVTVGNRFHHRGFGHNIHGDCRSHSGWRGADPGKEGGGGFYP